VASYTGAGCEPTRSLAVGSGPATASRRWRRALLAVSTDIHPSIRELCQGEVRRNLFQTSPLVRSCYSAFSTFRDVAGRNHREMWAGCIVSLTTPTRSSLNASRSVSFRNCAEKVSKVFLASYFLL
jgi:hypothetical protein